MGIRPIKGKIIVTIVDMALTTAIIIRCIAVVIERGNVSTPAYVVSACYASTIYRQGLFFFTRPKGHSNQQEQC
jgi:hypothetical protein